MEMVRDYAALFFFALAALFTLAGVAGLFRFPDPYSRLQAGSLAGTTAAVSVFIGALILAPSLAIAARILIILLFFLLSSPTGAHIVARFTWNSDIPPWKPENQGRSGQKLRDGSGDRGDGP